MARKFLTSIALANLASAPGSPVAGLIYFDTTLNVARVYDGTQWLDMVASAEGTITSVSGDAPITSTGGTSPTIGITDVTTVARGAMIATDKVKLDGIESGATANQTDVYLLNRANHTGSQAISTVTGLQTALNNKLETSLKGAINGLAELDGDGKVPTTQLPALAITSTTVVADIAARDALTVQEGDVAIVQNAGAGEPASYIYDGTVWQELLTPTDGVTAVTGGTGITSTGGATPEISITAGGVGTTELADGQVTEVKLATAVQTKLNETGILKHAENLGDGTTTSFVVTHSFNTRDLTVSVYDNATFEQVEAGVVLTTLDTATISFSVAPTASAYRVVIIG